MSDFMAQLYAAIAELEKSTEAFAEHAVSHVIRSFKEKCPEQLRDREYLWECMAFDFYERDDSTDEGITYFGPMASGEGDSGELFEWPNASDVDQDCILYWEQRASSVAHPLLRSRYALLSWEFSSLDRTMPSAVSAARSAIDAAIEMGARGAHKYERHIIRKLDRALSIALSIRDAARAERVRDAILAYEDRIISESKYVFVGFAYDLLLVDKSTRKLVDDRTRDIIVGSMETCLESVCSGTSNEGVDPFTAESIAIRLAQYYRKENTRDDVVRVLTKYGQAFELKAETASSLVASGWLQGVHRHYREFGLRKEADALEAKLRKVNQESLNELQEFSTTVETPVELMDKFVSEITSGTPEKALKRIARQFIPDRSMAETEISEIAQAAPLMSMIPRQAMDRKGRPVSMIDSLEKDPEGHVVLHIGQKMLMDWRYLRLAIEGTIESYNLDQDELTDRIYESPVFESEHRGLLLRGLERYLAGDYVSACHILIPQIEAAIRKLVELCGGPIINSKKLGGFDLRTLDALLRDPHLSGAIGGDCALYFRILLTDRRGWNLRNNLCHGLYSAESVDVIKADRVFHALLYLGFLRTGESVED